MSATGCVIWGTVCESSRLGDSHHLSVVGSIRAGGDYKISLEAKDSVRYIDDKAKARLTTWLVNQRNAGVHMPLITSDIVESVTNSQALLVSDRAKRLLAYFVRGTQSIGQPIDIDLPPQNVSGLSLEMIPRASRHLHECLAWTESTIAQEVKALLGFLEKRGWLSQEHHQYNSPVFVTVTVEGFQQHESDLIDRDSRQAFVAMWFNDAMKEAYLEGIALAIEEAGYSAIRVDQEEYIDKVDDKIIAEIRRSRFLVADFSQGEDGARGGVYFEAGFALGLGIPVIFTCRSSDMDDVHFDTRQYNHIVWNSSEELREALKNRILAVIGEGPNISPTTT